MREFYMKIREGTLALMHNWAFWLLILGNAAFWVFNAIVGTEYNRYVQDIAICFLAMMYFFLRLPDSIDAFMAGGARSEWRFKLGVELLCLQIAIRSIWAFATKWYDRPEWMIESPLNGLWQFWGACALGLMLWGISDAQMAVARQRTYTTYILVAVVAVGAFFVGRLVPEGNV